MMARFNDLASLSFVAVIAMGLVRCDGAAITCPTLKKYSTEFMQAAGKELTQIQTSAPHVAILVDDYGVDRDAIRKCIELRSKDKG
jgi:hypothetical protein